MTEAMKLDAHVFAGYRERFLERMPDFADFTVKSGTYWVEERQYKEDISNRCLELLPASLFELSSADSGEDVYQAVRTILTERVKSTGKPQNIVGWREAAALREYGPNEKRILAEALGVLLYESQAPAQKIDRFNEQMWPVFKGNKSANPFARSRTIPTFFLMMIRPIEHITVRTDLFDDVSMDLLGRSILDNQVFTGAEYVEILELAALVKSHLERWGWSPVDMIDVHSFLWTACWEYEPDDNGEEQ